MCALKCVDQGLVTLDEDITPRLPYLAAQSVSVLPILFFAHPAFVLGLTMDAQSNRRQRTGDFKDYVDVPRKGPITLRHLLTMTAGTDYPGFSVDRKLAKTIPEGKDPYIVPERVRPSVLCLPAQAQIRTHQN